MTACQSLNLPNLHYLHFDLPGYGSLIFGQRYRQHSILEFSQDLAALDKSRQRETPHELTILSLDAVIVLAIDRCFKFTFTAHCKHVVFKSHVHGVLTQFRQLQLERNLLVGLIDVAGWCPSCEGPVLIEHWSKLTKCFER